MNDWKCAIRLATCCVVVLTMAPSASADFVGVTTVIKDDPDTDPSTLAGRSRISGTVRASCACGGGREGRDRYTLL